MLELVLIRHGETALNQEKAFRGRKDVPLSETGLRQAERLAAYLGLEQIDIIYSSPLQRAVQTARPLAERLGIDVNTVENLTDMDFGEWQGATADEVAARYPDEYQDWQDTPEQVRIPGGETLAEVLGRMESFIRGVIGHTGEGRVGIVSHRVVLKVLICHLLQLSNASFWSFKLDTAGVTRFNIEGGRAALTGFNDISFLDGLGLAVSDF